MRALPISVIVAVRDGARYAADSLRSVLDQQGPAFEVVVVDDGSSDETPEILSKLAGQDARLKVARARSQGLTASLRQGIGLAAGRYLARHDADDVSLPGRFARQYDFLEGHPEVAAIGTGAEVIDAGGQRTGGFPMAHGAHEVRRDLLTLRTTPVHGSMMIRRAALEAAGGYDSSFRAAQDYDLWLRLSESQAIDNLPDVLYQWRMTPGGVYGERRIEQLRYAGIALAFAWERERFGQDSRRSLAACAGDLDRFAAGYRGAGWLHAIWGELLFRNRGNSPQVRAHLREALRLGSVRPRTLCLLGWAHLGLPWPGGKPMRRDAQAGVHG